MSEPSNNPVRVLLVEDNPGDARLVQETLAQAGDGGFELTHVDRLSAALDRLEEGGIDLVLLDLVLPDSWGAATCLMTDANAPEVPIVVLTGFDDETLAIQSLREGAQDYLVKGQLDGQLLVRSMRYAVERKRVEVERERLVVELMEALEKVKTLSGLLPICASCKKIRDDKGYWSQIETYLGEHSEAEFSHGICPDCAQDIYPQLVNGPSAPSSEKRL